jgi:hypothetical protein
MMHLASAMTLELSAHRHLACAAAATLALATSTARADEQTGYRFGLVGSIGGGLALVGHPGPLSGFVGMSELGFELIGEKRPWGGFLGGDYLSSGDDGRWNAFGIRTGVDYRVFGTSHSTALFLRGGLTYQRWLATSSGCPVDIFVPNSCNLEGAMPPSFQATTDMLGLVGGVRVEMPLRPVYIAFSGKLVPTVSIDNANPVATLQLRVTMELGFKDTRSTPPSNRQRNPYEFHSHPGSK